MELAPPSMLGSYFQPDPMSRLGTLTVEVVDWLALAAGKDGSSCPSEERGAF